MSQTLSAGVAGISLALELPTRASLLWERWAAFEVPPPSRPGVRLVVEAVESATPAVGLTQVPMPALEPSGGAGWKVEGEGWRAEVAPSGTEAVVRQHPDDAFAVETVAKLLLARAVMARGGLVLHAVGLTLDGVAAVFPGRSGAGKSTLGTFAQAGGAGLLADELVAVLPGPDGLVAHGTPWNVGFPRAAPLRLLGMLAHAATHRIEDCPQAEVVRVALENTLLPEPPARAVAFRRLVSWVQQMRAVRLHFARDSGVASALREAAH